MAAVGSIAPVDVVPTADCTSTGRMPAATSATIASRSATTSIACVTGSTAIERTALSPRPLIIAALSSDEWAWVEP